VFVGSSKHSWNAVKLKSARAGIDTIIASQKTSGGMTAMSAQVKGVEQSILQELAAEIGAKIASNIVVLDVASSGKGSLGGF
jgi:hypothetical protein